MHINYTCKVFCLSFVLGSLASSCSSSDDTTLSTDAAVAGPETTRCINADNTPIIETVDPAVCGLTSITPNSAIVAAHGGHIVLADATADTGTMSEYGDTLYNAAGPDDECKYNIQWSSTPVSQNKNVTFNLKAVTRADNKPVTGAEPSIEVFLDESTPGPSTNQATQETSNGVYSIGPVQFNKPGKWTVRFHLYGQCGDEAGSPHGHAAFFVSVP